MSAKANKKNSPERDNELEADTDGVISASK